MIASSSLEVSGFGFRFSSFGFRVSGLGVNQKVGEAFCGGWPSPCPSKTCRRFDEPCSSSGLHAPRACKFGHVTLESPSQENPRTPPSGNGLWFGVRLRGGCVLHAAAAAVRSLDGERCPIILRGCPPLSRPPIEQRLAPSEVVVLPRNGGPPCENSLQYLRHDLRHNSSGLGLGVGGWGLGVGV